MNMRLLAVAVIVLGTLAGIQVLAAGPASSAAPAASAGVVAETKWEDLVPKDWDPTKRFRSMNLGMMNDSNPKVLQMMREMRETWDNAPTNDKMDGATVRLPGYVVPLDEVDGKMKEFLLVPYFGACIHTPPPPANQIVHVIVDKPMKGLRMMDAVWVSGTLKTGRLDTVMGTSGYRMQAVVIDPYVAPSRP
jgi:hypothetical protein